MSMTIVTRVLYDLTENQVPDDVVFKGLLRLWNEKRGGFPMPRREEIPTETLKPWLGHLSLIAPIDGGRDFVTRLHGSTVAAQIGRDLTRMRLSEAPHGFGVAMLPICRRTLTSVTPTLFFYNPPEAFSVRPRVNLVLPLGATDPARAEWLLIAGYPATVMGGFQVAEPEVAVEPAAGVLFGF